MDAKDFYSLGKPKKRDWKGKVKILSKASKPYRSLILYVYFCIHCLIGATIFYFIEHSSELVLDSKVTSADSCIGTHDFWGALFFSIAASSTIGFGILYPCTLLTRLIGIIYAMVGIPLFVAVLAKFGDHFYQFVVFLYMPFWRKIQERREIEIAKEDARRAMRRQMMRQLSSTTNVVSNLSSWIAKEGGGDDSDVEVPLLTANNTAAADGSIPLLTMDTLENFNLMENGEISRKPSVAIPRDRRKSVIPESDAEVKEMVSQILGEAEDEVQDTPDLPVSLGFMLILVCIALCGIFYYYMESYAIFDSIYYAFLTFLAGDFGTSTYYLGVPVFILLFVGFSMVSTTISIISNNIENLMKRVKREVRRELERQIADAAAEGRELDLDTSKLVHDIIAQQGGKSLLKNFISDDRKAKFEATTVEQCDKVQALTYGTVETQTDSSLSLVNVVNEETGTQASETVKSRETLTDSVGRRTQKVQFAPITRSSGTSTPSVTKRNRATYRRPAVRHRSSQSPRKISVDKGAQKGMSVSNKIAQATPSTSNKAPDTKDLVQTRSQTTSAVPTTRTAKIQVNMKAAGKSNDSTPSSYEPSFSLSRERSQIARQRWKDALKAFTMMRYKELHPEDSASTTDVPDASQID